MRTIQLISALLALQFTAAAAENFVAEPDRAYDVVWKKFPKKGKDFWLVLYPTWFGLKGVSQEEFVQKSAISDWLFYDANTQHKLLTLRELTVFDSKGKKITPQVSFSVGPKDMVLYRDSLTDGKRNTYCVLTGDISNVKTRFRPLKAGMKISSAQKISKFQIHYGWDKDGKIASAKLKNAAGKITQKNNILEVKLDTPATSAEIELVSNPVVYKPWIIQRKRLAESPFILRPRNRWINGKFWGLTRENIDQKVVEDIQKKYPDTFIGIQLGEWDANIMHTLPRPNAVMYEQLTAFLKVPADREMMVKNFKIFWDHHKEVYGKNLFGLSGQFNYQHYGLDNGGTLCAQELTPEHSDTQFRVSYVFQRGAARQYAVPSMMYHANFVWNYTCNWSEGKPGKFVGMNYGSPPSLSLRNYYTAYYTGNNYISCENQPYGQAWKGKNGLYELTANGKALKDIYEWTKSEKGKRGESYAPILLLADRKHGFDANHRLPWQTYWKGLMPLREGDLLLEYTMQAISPNFGLYPYMKKTQGKPNYNLRNSVLGDIFDLYIANPLKAPEVSVAQLEKYPVVFPINNITFTQTLADTFKTYVFNGGTLVLTAGQFYAFENDKDFTGLEKLQGSVKKDGLILNKFKPLKGTAVLMKTSDGTPLVYKKRYGKGNLLVVTSPYMKKAGNVYKAPAQMTALLKNLQREVLPIQVEGNCQFMFNVMPDGTWKVILINNDGVNKAPWESVEQFDQKCTSTVRLIAPAGTSAIELRRNAPVKVSQEGGKKVYSVTIPPAEIFVVDITGIPRKTPQKVSRKAAPAVKDFVYVPYKPAQPFDGYKKAYYPIKGPKKKAPEIVGKWTAANGFRSAVGGKDMEWTGKQVFDGKNRNYARVTFPADFTGEEGTWSIWAKPLPFKDYPVNFEKRKRGGVVYGKSLHIEYDNGRWVLGGQEVPLWVYYQGPKVTGNWDHLAAVWKGSIIRFFVNGKEVRSPLGPMKLPNEFGVVTYSKTIPLLIGAIAPAWPQPCLFAGSIGDFTWYGRALSAKEIQALAKKKPAN